MRGGTRLSTVPGGSTRSGIGRVLAAALCMLLGLQGVTPAFAASRPTTPSLLITEQRVDAGGYFGAEIRSDGSLWTWGYNYYGQLGDDSWVSKLSPVQVGTDRDWVAVSAGDSHALAIKSDGTLWAWGFNDFYQLGLGTTDPQWVPERVGADDDWVAVSAGSLHSLGLKSDGTLWAWGDNERGQLGQGDQLDEWTPKRVGSDADWVAIAAGYDYSSALKADGSLWSWGDNTYGQLGVGDNDPHLSPVKVIGHSDWAMISAGGTHSLGLKSDGTLWAWGQNSAGQLGLDDYSNRNSPQQVASGTSWRFVGTGRDHSLAIKGDGTLWTWGQNMSGQLGLGDTTVRDVPTQVGTRTDWVAVSGGETFSLAVANDGTVWTAGDNTYAELGTGDLVSRSTFGQSGVQADWESFAAGEMDTLAVRDDGTLWGWGLNAAGELGTSDTIPHTLPIRIGSSADWTRAAQGRYFSLALKDDGSLWASGQNNYGQLGLGDTTTRMSFTRVPSAIGWVSVAAGDEFALGVKEDGTLWSWGFNQNGQLGHGDDAERHSPTQVGSDADWVTVGAGSSHAFAIKRDGTLWGWGFNSQGQLGTGDDNEYWEPVKVGMAHNWLAVDGGMGHTLALNDLGELYAMGYNGYGQLGLGDTTDRWTPTRVGTGSDWVAVSAGLYSSSALRGDGTVWSCGSNSDGQLGDGTSTNRSAMVQAHAEPGIAAVAQSGYHTVAAGSDGCLYTWGSCEQYRLATFRDADQLTPRFIMGGRAAAVGGAFVATAAGYFHSLAIKSDGTLWAWGDNSAGQLGRAAGSDQLIPLQVGTDDDWVAVAAGGNSSLAIKSDGTLWAWGDNSWGQLGLGDKTGRSAPTQVTGWSDWRSISFKAPHVLALRANGTLWAWGADSYGELGLDYAGEQLSPTQVGGDTDWVSAAAGVYHSAGLKSDGTLWTWGRNNSGQLGLGSTENTGTPAQVGTDDDWTNVACSFNDTFAVKAGGTLWGCGKNALGQTGTGFGPDVLVPTQVGSEEAWTSVRGGMDHGHAIRSDGTLWGWGFNAYGQVGDGENYTEYVPVPVGTGNDWLGGSSGANFSLGTAPDGSLWAWGDNGDGQLGDASTADTYAPKETFAPGDVVTPVVLAVRSTTHPFEGVPGADTFSAEVYAVDGQSDVRGMSWEIDDNPDTVPDDELDVVGASGGVSTGATSPGAMYLHVRAQDMGYNWSATRHYEFIVNTPPDAADDPGLFSAVTKAMAADGMESAQLGSAVDIDGDTAVVGAPYDDHTGSNAGSAYVFVKEDGDWVQQAKLTPADPADEDLFGSSVAVSGDTVVVGSPLDDSAETNGGAAYIFTRSGTDWSQQLEVLPEDIAPDDQFGYSVAIEGDSLLVGSVYDDDDGDSSGSAYAYGWTGTAWQLQDKLTAADPYQYDYFGCAVALSGDTAVIGSYYDDDKGSQSGSAYVFTVSENNWTQQDKLVAGDGAAGDNFGIAVDVEGDTAIVGAWGDDGATGSAYVFMRAGADWSQQQKLVAADAAPADYAGHDVAVSGDLALVGSPLDDDPGSACGAVYAWARAGDTWSQMRKIEPDDAADGDALGKAVALDGGNAVLGAPTVDAPGGYDHGAAYVYSAGAYTILEDQVLNVSAPGLLANDRDANGDALTVTSVSNGTYGSVTHAGDGSFSYEPLSDWSGTDTFTYEVSDGNGGTDEATVSVRVTPVNDAPVAADNEYDAEEDAQLSVPAGSGVLGNDTDVDGDTLSADVVTDVAHGTLVLSDNGSFTYTPDAGYHGTDSFTYVANDGTVDSNQAQVTIDVGAVNDAPVAVDDAFATSEDTKLIVSASSGVLDNDHDADGDRLRAELVTDAAHGDLALAADGSFTYTPDADWSGADTFTYRASDGSAVSAVATVEIEVTAVNDAPVAHDDAYAAVAGTSLVIGAAQGVLVNDADVEGDELMAHTTSNPAHGTVTLAEDGAFTYVPAAGFSGEDSFTYVANDGTDDSAPATVAITVSAAGPALPGGLVRVAGADRYATAIEGSKRAFPDGAATVVIATGANWPDALGGSALAGVAGGPLLLTQPTVLPAAVAAEIDRLGATDAYILGGTGAVSQAVEAQLVSLLGSGHVTRLAGADRYATARAVADRVIELAGDEYDGGAIVATGGNYPDALAGSPLAAAKVWPILLAHPGTGALYVPDAVTDAVILGGTGAVSPAVESALAAELGGGNVRRLGGANRYTTAALVAAHGVEVGLHWDGVGVATGENFPDALSAGAMLGRFRTVMLLTQSTVLSSDAQAALQDNAAEIGTVFVIGGTGAVSDSVATAIEAAAGL